MFQFQLVRLQSLYEVDDICKDGSFNSNWFDYSMKTSWGTITADQVSIPTGSITVMQNECVNQQKHKFQFQLVRLQLTSSADTYDVLSSFNSNWFDYSCCRRYSIRLAAAVSIPTGSITVHLLSLGGPNGPQFQFQLVRLQYYCFANRNSTQSSFNSNWFDYSCANLLENALLSVFQFQLVRLQSYLHLKRIAC